MNRYLIAYHYCKKEGCNQRLTPEMKAYALQRFELIYCSPTCRQTDWKGQGLCCERAEILNCVCGLAYKCDVHGTVHKGTHE